MSCRLCRCSSSNPWTSGKGRQTVLYSLTRKIILRMRRRPRRYMKSIFVVTQWHDMVDLLMFVLVLDTMHGERSRLETCHYFKSKYLHKHIQMRQPGKCFNTIISFTDCTQWSTFEALPSAQHQDDKKRSCWTVLQTTVPKADATVFVTRWLP